MRGAGALIVALAAVCAGATPAAGERGAPQLVRVTLREYTIGVPARLKPGPTTFVIRNVGRYPHNFTAIFGPIRFASATVGPGQTTRLEVKLVPGAYVAACTVLDGGHIAKGMIRVFTIGSRAPGSGVWQYP